MSTSVAIVVGHRAGRRGASDVNGTSEWTWCRGLAEDVVRILGKCGEVDPVLVFRPDRPGGYMEQANALNNLDPDWIVELHFNAGGGTGTEVLHHPLSTNGQRLATSILRCVVEELELPDRGTKGRRTNDRGNELLTITRTRAPAVIVETHFGDSTMDVERASTRKPGLAHAIVEGVLDVIGGPHA